MTANHMELQPINYGAAANDGTGDSLREAMRKAQGNFEYLDQAKADAQTTAQALAAKVDKSGSKVLSDNNFTNAQMVKLANIADGASNDRSKHTGAQAIATVEGLEDRLDAALRVKIIADATSTKDYLQKIVALGPGYYRHYVSIVELPNIPPESAGFLSVTGDTFSLLISSYSTADLTVISGTLNDIASGTWRVNVIGKSERGSNANGDYVRFSDGTLICTANRRAKTHDGPWTYPSAFAIAPSLGLNNYANGLGGGIFSTRILTNTATNCSFELDYWTGSAWAGGSGESMSCTAIGRWK
ncbi:MAG: hypothetical protein RR574_10145 [Comamonas sp.]